ncbi:hypothetical protein DVB88_12175 [Tsukamurella pulmonis]|nr:hypothetical protein DVB88_12175 [Tsukamurella pulmonis]
MTADQIAGTHFSLAPRLARYRTLGGPCTGPHFAGGFQLVHRPSGRVVAAPDWPFEPLDAVESLDVLRGLAGALEAAPVDWASSRPLASARAADAALEALEAALGCAGDVTERWLR